jgi:diguanylate cyclase (GGDEF)-like protein
VSQREVALAFQLRDHHGASRSVAYLMLAGAPFVLITGVLVGPPLPAIAKIGITLLSVLLGVGGWLCWGRPHLMPGMFWLLAPFVTAVMITTLNVATSDASTGAQLFYLWPTLYSASFLSRRVIYVSLAFQLGCDAINVFTQLEPGKALSDLAAMTLAMSMIAIVVLALRDRADQLLRVVETQARVDSLTGLANRRSFDEDLARASAWARRNDGRLALLTVDVDYFKKINDTWGHVAGDRALQALATAMKSVATGDDDVVARLGGDEFVMLLRADRPAAVRAAEALRTAVAAINVLPGGPPGVSIGLAVLPDDGATVEALMAASDAALYDAKTSGRGRVAAATRPESARHNVDRVSAS